MFAKRYSILSLLILFGCQTTPTPSPPFPISPSASASAPVITAPPKPLTPQAPIASAIPTTSPTLSAPDPTQPIAVAPGQPGIDLSAISALELKVSNPYLDGMGETTQLQAVLKDRQGQALAPQKYPLEWLSSRPGDFSVDASGKVTALVEYGYSEITLKIAGTSLSAKQLLSVTTLTGSGGSGSAAKPTQEKVSGSVKFEF